MSGARERASAFWIGLPVRKVRQRRVQRSALFELQIQFIKPLRGLRSICDGKASLMLLAKLKCSVLYALGSRAAEGRLNRIHLAERLRADWLIYCGEQGVGPTLSNIHRFAQSRYGVDLSGLQLGDPHRLWSARELGSLWEELARGVLAQRDASEEPLFSEDDEIFREKAVPPPDPYRWMTSKPPRRRPTVGPF